jgi:hypothetical protein
MADDPKGKKFAMMIPAGEVIMAMGLDPLEGTVVNISWNGRSMSMFLVDFRKSGERVLEV